MVWWWHLLALACCLDARVGMNTYISNERFTDRFHRMSPNIYRPVHVISYDEVAIRWLVHGDSYDGSSELTLILQLVYGSLRGLTAHEQP